jgi:type II secretory pathway predicted ATPase ExeA
MSLREEVRSAVRVYMSRTGMSIGEIANLAGLADQTVKQFISSARFGTPATAGEFTARQLAECMKAHPPRRPEIPGRLYETEATRAMDRMLRQIARGRWGTLYGPAGAQKTFLLRYRAAEAACDSEPWLALVEADPDLSPRVLLARIAQAISAPFAVQTEALRRAILETLRARQTSLAVAIDEAQLLYRRVDTLETLRRLGDHAGERMGILVAGNEQVEQLFEPRRRMFFEQWRSRIEQKKLRVLGPARDEARAMIAGELGEIKESAAAILLDKCTVRDPVSGRSYINARRLFNSLRDAGEERAARAGSKARVN